jgi:hypothetical protein
LAARLPTLAAIYSGAGPVAYWWGPNSLLRLSVDNGVQRHAVPAPLPETPIKLRIQVSPVHRSRGRYLARSNSHGYGERRPVADVMPSACSSWSLLLLGPAAVLLLLAAAERESAS